MTSRRLNTLIAALIALASAAHAADVDLHTPGMQRLRQAYLKQVDAPRVARLAQLEKVLEEQHAAMDALLKEKTRSGNVTGQAVARNGLSILEKCGKSLEAKGDFEVPENVRAQLAPMTRGVAQAKERIDGQYGEEVAAVKQQYAERFAAQVRAQGHEDLDAEALSGLFVQLVEGSGKPPEKKPEQTPAEGKPDEGEEDKPDAGTPTPSRPVPTIASGEGGNWVTLARWQAEVSGIEVVGVPVMDRREGGEKEHASMMTGKPFMTHYDPLRVLVPGDGYVFRIRQIVGSSQIDIIEWPAPRNEWTMQARIRPTRELPATSTIEIQVSFPGAADLPFAEGVTAAAPESAEPQKLVEMMIDTRPQGAVVYVDNFPLKEDGKYVVTPCTISVPEGARDLKLRLRGYLDGLLPGLQARDGRRLTLTLRKNPNFEKKSITVPARSSWTSSQMTVQKGDRLRIVPSGEWSCGKKREKVGPRGYENNQQFFHYYLDPKASPRQMAGVNYGALLLRIGEDGKMVPVGMGMKLTVNTPGELFFGINEVDDSSERRDNAGALRVDVERVPGE